MRRWNRGCVSRLVIAGVAATLIGRGGFVKAETPAEGPRTPWSQRWMPREWHLPRLPTPDWKLPSVDRVLPGGGDHPPVIRKKDSLLEEVSETAKEGWWRTKAAFGSSRLHPGRLFASEAEASRDHRRTAAAMAEEDSPGLFGSIFGGQQQRRQRPEQTAVIENFMSQPRPRR